jgi:hypothetical protein
VCASNSELWNTEIKENQEIVRKRKRKLRYISNIMVISDPKHPENEGKVFLYSYGSKIFAKLMGAITPEFEDEESFNPFDLWTGAAFKLKIRFVEGFRNYDKSEFEDPSQLMEDDAALEKVWESEYSLQEFLAPLQFKSYDELKKKLFMILGSAVPATRQSEEHEQEPEAPQAPRTSRPASKPAEEASKGDEDDFKLFSSLIDD